jgi:serine/threonine protein kinase/tetratricopeptide (TPR) repeat protein
MPQPRADRNLLFGILALHNGFITRDALIRAMSVWVAEKENSLGAILVRQGDLTEDNHRLLELLVRSHLGQHGDDPSQSLAALSSSAVARALLSSVPDDEVISCLTTGSMADAGPPAGNGLLGTSTSAGQRFRVLRPHAEGGLGAVYLARDEELNRDVALKQIKGLYSHDHDQRARFVAEAEITGGLEHPGVVPVYGLGRDELGRPFYAMRFVKGDSLRDAIVAFHRAEVPGRDPGERALELRKLLGRFVDVCDALAYAHSRGVVHRDVKPANVMLGKFGETLVVDWGLAKAVGRDDPAPAPEAERTLRPSSAGGSAATLPGSALGTPAYMSPEQAAGRIGDVGFASDVYSLGATLYDVLTGRPPFTAGTVEAIVAAVERGDFPRPRQVNGRVPAPLEAVCLKAMARHPADRYPSALALAEDIEHWLADEPVSALRERPLARLARWTRRNRAWVAAGAVVLMVATALTAALAAQQARSAERERRVALRERQARALAQARLAEIEKVNALLASIFTDLDPRAEEKDARPLRAILGDRLHQAADQLDAAGVGDPLVVANMQNMLGRALQNLGFAEHAVAVQERSRKIRNDVLGPDHHDTLDTCDELANALSDANRVQDALALHEDTWKRRVATLGPDAHDSITSLDNLAQMYVRVGRTKEGIAMLSDSIERHVRVLGADHPETLTARSNLGWAYGRAGMYDEAIAANREAHRLREARLGPRHADTLVSRFNLAQSLRMTGRFEEAIRNYEEVVRLRRATLGPDHPRTIAALGDLGSAWFESGQPKRSIPLLEEASRLASDRLGVDHPYALLDRASLAAAYGAVGRMNEAVALLETTLKLQMDKLGPNHRDTLLSQGNLGEMLINAGRGSEAVALLETALKGRESLLGPAHPDTMFNRRGLALAYLAAKRPREAETLMREQIRLARQPSAGDSNVLATLAVAMVAQERWNDAESMLRECLAIRTRTIPNEWSRFNTMSQLGGVLSRQGRHGEAEPLVVAGYEGLNARVERLTPIARVRFSEAAARVVAVFEAAGQREKALEWRVRVGLAVLPDDVFARP